MGVKVILKEHLHFYEPVFSPDIMIASNKKHLVKNADACQSCMLREAEQLRISPWLDFEKYTIVKKTAVFSASQQMLVLLFFVRALPNMLRKYFNPKCR